jgi:aldose 1-epimerase
LAFVGRRHRRIRRQSGSDPRKTCISALAIAGISCQIPASMKPPHAPFRETYGTMPDGREVGIFTLCNRNGLEARVTEYGAILVSMKTPDRRGVSADLTLGHDSLDGWMCNGAYFGATVGRFGNRIQGGRFALDGREYTLATNNHPGGQPCHLHGGIRGFDKMLWSGKANGGNSVEFSYLSKDGEEGYPGNLDVRVGYTLTDDDELIWEASAVTDAPTVVNIIHHSYWNLSGNPATSTDDHELMLAAPFYLPTDAGLIPTGELAPVTGTPMDFITAKVIGERLGSDFEAMKTGGGYDHCWVLDGNKGVRLAARLKDPKTGRVMELLTNQPGIQFYGGNGIEAGGSGKGGHNYGPRCGLCLETEAFPDSPNQPGFPPAVLRPGETYQHVMIHKFSAE